jgi:hypothetical protein
MMMALAMGVIQTSQPGPIRPFDQPGGGLQVAGVAGNEFLMDGAPNANTATGGASAYSPPEDAVTEVAANAFQSDAAYGHAGGGMVDLIIKSGTNSVHGSVSEFVQTSALDANSFFANRAGTARPVYRYNQYGLTAGGPLWIPKIFNGKNRVFWFFGFEGIKDSDPATSPLETGNPVYVTTVPTAPNGRVIFRRCSASTPPTFLMPSTIHSAAWLRVRKSRRFSPTMSSPAIC